jgi:TetR/AcrR family acrAB operon transcriptional repressor
MEQGGGTIEMLRRMLVSTWEYLESNDDFRAVMELTMLKTGVDAELEEGMKMKRQGTRIMTEKLAEMLHEGIVKGELRADLDPMEIARAFLAVQNGLALLWLLDPEAFSLRHSAYTTAEIFVRGIQA